MSFAFQSYPTHTWMDQWTMEPNGCHASQRGSLSSLFFKTHLTVGRVGPNVDHEEWTLQVPVPQNCRIALLSNGFCGYFNRKRDLFGAEVLIPEPGVLWGRFKGIPVPSLLSEKPIKTREQHQWLETDYSNVLLATRNDTFCLIANVSDENSAFDAAEVFLSQDIESVLEEEFDRRREAVGYIEATAHHNALAVICAETMLKSLRPAEGRIPLTWSQSSSTDRPQFDLNELLVLAPAWSHLDIGIAEELVLCALKLQTNAGAIPVQYSPHTTYSVLESIKPLMVKTAEKVWEVRKDQNYLKTILPLLRRHVQWLIHHFDPKRRGTYCWKNSNEPIIPELYETDLATVDLVVLLLSEIEALNRLQSHSSSTSHTAFFNDVRAAMDRSILDLFWSDRESAFSNAYVRDSLVTIHGLPELTPLLLNNLPLTQKRTILELVQDADDISGKNAVLRWKPSDLGDPSFPLLQQYLLLLSLNNADPNGKLLIDFSSLTIKRFVEWHAISMESSNTFLIRPLVSAYFINVLTARHSEHESHGKVGGTVSKAVRKARIDRTDVMVVAAMIVLLYGVHTIYDLINTPPPLDVLEAQMNSAYTQMDPSETLQYSQAIIQYYPEHASRAKLLAANTLAMSGAYTLAENLLVDVRQEYPDSPAAMVALGLSLQLQGKFTEAEANYYEFCYLFDMIFPDVVKQVNEYRYLMDEGFSEPPNWKKIYRYQFMHEL